MTNPDRLTRFHCLLVLAVVTIWGLNFVAIRYALLDLPPLLLAAVRFFLVGLLAFVVPKPKISWAWLVAIGMMLLGLQFAFLFMSIANGMPAGMASVVVQNQVFITILIAAFLGEKPGKYEIGGILVGFLGLMIITSSVDGSMSFLGLTLALLASLSWAIGNILVRRSGSNDMFSVIIWASLVPVLPLFVASLLIEKPESALVIWNHLSLEGAISILFIVLASTIFGYGSWAHLLRLYRPSVVTPFALLIPPVGMISASFVFGEQFTRERLVGTALIMLGLIIGTLAKRWVDMRLSKG